MAPVLTGLVLLVLWVGDSGRAGLSATLAAEEAAVAAGEMCTGGDGGGGRVDGGCASAVAEQVVAARTPAGAGCTAEARLNGGGQTGPEAGRAVIVEVACDGQGAGAVHTATGMHIPRVGFDAEPVPVYTGDRPTEFQYCQTPWILQEPYPVRPDERGPGNADTSWLTTAVFHRAWPSYRPDSPHGGNPVVCAPITHTVSDFRRFSHDFVLAVWTEDVRDSSFGFRKIKAGDTCENAAQTGVSYLRIPKEHPQYLWASVADARSLSGYWRNGERLTFPFGRCDGRHSGYTGLFELHVEIVSGGAGSGYLLCDLYFCEPIVYDSSHVVAGLDCAWAEWINSKRKQPYGPYTKCVELIWHTERLVEQELL